MFGGGSNWIKGEGKGGGNGKGVEENENRENVENGEGVKGFSPLQNPDYAIGSIGDDATATVNIYPNIFRPPGTVVPDGLMFYP